MGNWNDRNNSVRRQTGYGAGMILAFALAVGCTGGKQDTLTVRGGEQVTYQCENGIRIVARYYTLSDSSLNFVKLQMPDGKEYTLPNAVSASGARYTDERELVWWTKGDSAFVQTRGENGEWQVRYGNCGIRREK
jgi:membrane-bound inhibitor of C-type lysozyme